MKVQDGKEKDVDEDYCLYLPKPDTVTKACNQHCRLEWVETGRSNCSERCGTGQQRIRYKCVKILVDKTKVKTAFIMIFTDRRCPTQAPVLTTYCIQELSLPVTVRECEGTCEGIKWVFGSWSECSQTCGGGEQSRLGRCQDQVGDVLEDRKCEKMPKVTHKTCGYKDCPRWVTGEWSHCSASCGRGERQRPYWCQQDSDRVSSDLCDAATVSAHREECSMDDCTKWIAGDWTPCSSDCGPGVRTRKVVCATQETQNQLPEKKCMVDKKPISNSSCIETSCSESENNEDNFINIDAATKKQVTKKFTQNYVKDKNISPSANKKLSLSSNANLPRYRWKIGHWTKCSENCGKGLQKRVVTCFDRVRGLMETDQRKCSRVRPKPRDKQPCNSKDCPVGKWLQGEWSSCSVSCGKVNN